MIPVITVITGIAWLAAWAGPVDLAGAVESVREGRFVEALLAAEADPDPSKRAEAALYVRHHAGDLTGALHVARSARLAGISTPWLEEREVFVALTLRDAAGARDALEALASRPDSGGVEMAALAQKWSGELDALQSTLDARDLGIDRAQATLAVASALFLALFSWIGVQIGRSRVSSRTPGA